MRKKLFLRIHVRGGKVFFPAAEFSAVFPSFALDRQGEQEEEAQVDERKKKHFPSINILLLAVFIIKEAIFCRCLPMPDWLDEKIMSPSTFHADESTSLCLFSAVEKFFFLASVNYNFSTNCRNANS